MKKDCFHLNNVKLSSYKFFNFHHKPYTHFVDFFLPQSKSILTDFTYLNSNLAIRCFSFAWLAPYSANNRASRTFKFSMDFSNLCTPSVNVSWTCDAPNWKQFKTKIIIQFGSLERFENIRVLLLSTFIELTLTLLKI